VINLPGAHLVADWKKGYVNNNAINRFYDSWVADNQYLIFKKQDSLLKTLASKRGNEKYLNRVKKRFALIDTFFHGVNISRDQTELDAKSRMLFITLTYGNRSDITLPQAWDRLSSDYNRFITNLRNKFRGVTRVLAIRCFEAHKNGYPHIHALLFFENFWFKIFKYSTSKWVKNQLRTRVRWLLSDERLREQIKLCWKPGFSDVQSFISKNYALDYILKYITKRSAKTHSELDEGKGTLNFALLWVAQKRAFAASRDLTLKQMHNSNSENLIEVTHGEPPPMKWEFHGILTSQGFISKADMALRRGLRRFKTILNPYEIDSSTGYPVRYEFDYIRRRRELRGCCPLVYQVAEGVLRIQ